MIKIVITGAECSGKTTLAKDLAGHYGAALVPEFARGFLSVLGRPYVKSDLITMAMGQQKSEQALSEEPLVICDTSLLVIKVWSKVKYKSVHPWITVLLQEAPPDLYILPDYNIPYEEDPLREHPDERDMLHAIYLDELNKLNIPWMSVMGTPKERLLQASKRIDALIQEKS